MIAFSAIVSFYGFDGIRFFIALNRNRVVQEYRWSVFDKDCRYPLSTTMLLMKKNNYKSIA